MTFHLLKTALTIGVFSVFVTTIRAENAPQPVKTFRADQVRLLPSPFKKAQDKDAAYLLTVEPDRLLVGFLRNAGLDPKATSYGGWELKSIAGHSLGHYLSAVSIMYASTGDKRFKERSEYIVQKLAACQVAGKDGLVSAIPNVRNIFNDISQGKIDVSHGLNGLWVPWYTQHKVLAGLLDAYKYCDNKQALEVAKKLGDWGIDITKNLDEKQFQEMLRCEFGGMNEAYYNLYDFTGEKKFLDMGDRFDHHAILNPLREGHDELRGKHANTQIPKVVGLARRYEIAGNELSAKEATAFFWDRVTKHHSYVTGGNSMGEHFGDPDRLNNRLRDDTTETCNTYNMLKLTKMLYTWTGDPEYFDFYERALFNHILPSMDLSDDPNKLFTYFVPLQSGGFRTYSSPNTRHEEQRNHWSCCHGTGMENHGKYNESIYFHGKEDGKDVLYVNLLIPSALVWKEKEIKISVTDEKIIVDAEKPTDLVVKVRVPRNTVVLTQGQGERGKPTSEPAESRTKASAFLAGEKWKSGQTVVAMPFKSTFEIETMPDNPNRIAFFHGPYLLAGNLGSIDKPITTTLDETSTDKVHLPIIISDHRDPERMIDRQAGTRLTVAKPKPVDLVPFYEATQRYAVYFDCFPPEYWTKEKARYKLEREELARFEELVVDRFQPGEMQPERDHDFKSERSSFGDNRGRRWRDARDGGWFEFDMKLDPESPCQLILTYCGDDGGNREFDIMIDGTRIATQKLDRNLRGEFFDVSHKILNPDKKDQIRVRLQAHAGKMAGGLYDAKTARVDKRAENPIIWADVPDMSIVRVGDEYYMSSTTMHLFPGLPIMKSTNLVDWEIVSYAHDALADTDGLSLRNGKSEYGYGSWASSIRHHDGTFHVATFAVSTKKTHIYSTKDIKNEPWKETSFEPMMHDPSLVFDDGKVYMLYGARDLRLTELLPDLSGVKPGGFDGVILRGVGLASDAKKTWGEGSQLFKIDGKYYLCNITSNDMRTQVIHRADKLTGPYEGGRIMLHDRGIAQGGLVDTPDGRWFAYLFQDCGAVGRIPFLVPLKWEDGWPVPDKGGMVPMRLDIERKRDGIGNLVVSDEFDRPQALLDKIKAAVERNEYCRDAFAPAWQWNHNPDNRLWSLSARPGWLRLTTGRTDKGFVEARNSLTQRAFGPKCEATTLIDASGMKDGDYAGLAVLQRKYGFVGVKMQDGKKSIIMLGTDGGGIPGKEHLVSLEGDTVHLKIACDFYGRRDLAEFFWSPDGVDWKPLGSPVRMLYTIPQFMGYRFALFNFATENPGGFADFDYYRIND